MPEAFRCLECVGPMGHAFACLPDALAAQLTAGTVAVDYRRGQALFLEGTVPLAGYCIRSGHVKLSRHWSNGHEVSLGTRGPGEIVGLRAILTQFPYATTAEAIEPSTVCVIPRELFLDLLRQDHELALLMLKRLAIDSRMTEEQVVARSREEVTARTARLLVSLANAAGKQADVPVEIAMSRERMTVLVGTTRETLSRTLHGLAHQGVIDVEANAIRVRDLQALRALLE